MKKTISLIALALILLVSFVSCDYTGVFASVQNSTYSDNREIFQYIGELDDNKIFYLSRVNGLEYYDIANTNESGSHQFIVSAKAASTDLESLTTSIFKTSNTFAALDSTGKYIVVFNYSATLTSTSSTYELYIVDLTDSSNPVFAKASGLSYDNFNPSSTKDGIVYTTNGVYKLDVTNTDSVYTVTASTQNASGLDYTDGYVQILNGMYIHYKRTGTATDDYDFAADAFYTANPASGSYAYTKHNLISNSSTSGYNVAFSTNNIVAISDDHTVVMKNYSGTQYFYNTSDSSKTRTYSSGYAFGRTSSDDSNVVTSNCYSTSSSSTNIMLIAGPYAYIRINLNDLNDCTSSAVTYKKVLGIAQVNNIAYVFTENRGVQRISLASTSATL